MSESVSKLINDFKKSLDEIKDESFWQGFDACLMMALNSLDSQEGNDIAKFSVFEFIEVFKDRLLDEAELYKKNG